MVHKRRSTPYSADASHPVHRIECQDAKPVAAVPPLSLLTASSSSFNFSHSGGADVPPQTDDL